MGADTARAYFVTGTDTGIGKTRAAVALLEAFKARGLSVAGMKPIASGSEERKSVLTNEDALTLQAHSSGTLPYADVNPYAFTPPIAPHIAAARAGVSIDPEVLRSAFVKLAQSHDRVVVEGVGGWRVPLAACYTTADLVHDLALPVVLVVGLRLGCINHALLTHECLRNDGLLLAGWIANQLDPGYGETGETLQFLQENITVPLLGILPCQLEYDVKILSTSIDLDLLED